MPPLKWSRYAFVFASSRVRFSLSIIFRTSAGSAGTQAITGDVEFGPAVLPGGDILLLGCALADAEYLTGRNASGAEQSGEQGTLVAAFAARDLQQQADITFTAAAGLRIAVGVFAHPVIDGLGLADDGLFAFDDGIGKGFDFSVDGTEAGCLKIDGVIFGGPLCFCCRQDVMGDLPAPDLEGEGRLFDHGIGFPLNKEHGGLNLLSIYTADSA